MAQPRRENKAAKRRTAQGYLERQRDGFQRHIDRLEQIPEELRTKQDAGQLRYFRSELDKVQVTIDLIKGNGHANIEQPAK